MSRIICLGFSPCGTLCQSSISLSEQPLKRCAIASKNLIVRRIGIPPALPSG